MKPGDRVRVLRGNLEGRCGVIVDPAESIASVRRLIEPSATRDHLEEGLAVPAGCQLVRLDRPDVRDAAYVANRTVSIEEADLEAEDVRRIPLVNYLAAMEALSDETLRAECDIRQLIARLREAIRWVPLLDITIEVPR